MKVVEQREELRALAVEGLRGKISELDDQLFRLRMQASMGQSQSGNKLRPLRRQLARVKTLLREKGVRG
jgi:large subunit ribosomal protein L29